MKYLLSLLIIVFAHVGFAQIPAPQKNTYVNDFAKVLSKKDIKSINQSINKIEKKTGVQIAIVLVKKIPKQYQIEDYSLLIARRWKVGNKEDGLVYVAAIKQRKQRLEVARNLEPIFTEDASLAVLDRVKPFFKAADYAGGVTELVDAIYNDLDYAQYNSLPKVDSSKLTQHAVAKTAPEKEKKEDNTIIYIVVALVAGVFLYLVFPRSYAGGGSPGYGSGGYGRGGYNYGGGSSLGSFAAGAATGYLANKFLDNNKKRREEEENRRREEEEYRREEEAEARRREEEVERERAEIDRRSNTYGNWGSSRGSSGGSSSGSSSSSGGFSGGGATSDW